MATVEAITQQLQRDGYAISRDEIGCNDAIVARRARFHWTLTRLHIFVFLFSSSTLDAAQAAQMTAAAHDYAVAHERGLPRSIQTGVASIPVFIVNRAAPNAIAWARGRGARHWASLDLPVVIEGATGASAFHDKSRFWGAAYLPQLRRLASAIVAASRPST